MKYTKLALTCALAFSFSYCNAQKTVAGMEFSNCVNKKDLRHDFYKGKFLVLDFWATWCGPCIGSFPHLDALQKKYRNNSKVVFATMTTETAGHVDTFLNRKKDILPGVFFLTDKNAATRQYFNIYEIPHVIVFNPLGKVVFSGDTRKLDASVIDQLLKGRNMMEKTPAPAPAENALEKQVKAASFIAITGSADSTMQPGGSTYSSNTGDEITIKRSKGALKEVVEEVAGISGPRVTFNDSAKAWQPIFLYYRQAKSSFPEFDKGMFTHQYQNHVVDLLEKMYSFKCEWITEHTAAHKIVVKDSALLRKAVTISDHGAYGSSYGSKHTFVNKSLPSIAADAEDALNIILFAEATSGRYDLVLDFTSRESFEKSLVPYGLALERADNYEVKKLRLAFR